MREEEMRIEKIASGRAESGEQSGQLSTAPPPVNLTELIAYHADIRPEAVAVVQPLPRRRSLTWSQLEAQVSAVAAGLAAQGLVAGHRVALSGVHTIEFIVAYFATLRAGLVSVPVSPDLSDDELATILADSGARVLFAATAPRAEGVRLLPLTEDGLAAVGGAGSGPVLSPADREALAALLYTAGTSGPAKAAMLTHRALLSHLQHLEPYAILDEHSVVLSVLPVSHVFGLNAVLGSWAMAGARLVVTDAVEDLLTVIADEQVDNLPVSTSILYRLLQHDDLAAGLATVRTVVSGGSPMPQSLGAAFTDRTGLRVEQGYGLTEAAPGVTVTLGGEITSPGSVGRPLPGVDVRIGDGRDHGEPAEIWIRGDNLFSGYWPDGHGGLDADGWFATGDIGYLSAGELFLVDRAGELVVVNGFQVYPAEVETIIQKLPGVDAVAVIGRRDPRGREEVVAFVAGTGLTMEQIVDHCATSLARFKRPAQVYLVGELPRGATGKVKKGELRHLMDRGDDTDQVPSGGVDEEPTSDRGVDPAGLPSV